MRPAPKEKPGQYKLSRWDFCVSAKAPLTLLRYALPPTLRRVDEIRREVVVAAHLAEPVEGSAVSVPPIASRFRLTVPNRISIDVEHLPWKVGMAALVDG